MIASDPGTYGPPLQIMHLYYDQFPTGIAVTKTGRMFSNYPAGLDMNNTRYQVAELTTNTTETPYPNAEINSPPGGAVNYSTSPPTGANYQNYLIGVQTVAIDPLERLWILDTGRALDANGTLVTATYGGAKVVAVNTTSNTVVKTIVLPTNVAYPDSYLNDIRIDLRNVSGTSGQGVAYITDSSNEGRNGIVIVDIGTGEAWRHLDGTQYVHAETGFYGTIWGEQAVYTLPGPGEPYTHTTTGSDGIAFGNGSGDILFWTVNAGRYLYSIPTSYLRARGASSEIVAEGQVQNHGQKDWSDGMMQDSNGVIYAGSMETNAINVFTPGNGSVMTYVRDPRIGWPDSMWISTIGNSSYLYFTCNQLWRSPTYYPGTDRRVKPFVLFRVPTYNNGSRVAPQ